ncbi:serrate RNA effector molecule homolog isoform X2 [Nilaparvata lugens]|uniref:serrate RNA effector molecule homolog isoform X2 n=1 Tax=Nilaparvata lugens TaxID=108931 RepID=UPI000B988901|nr:serrate RNA effector molecule homolog isoform X2 [Nilaparvata lugens]
MGDSDDEYDRKHDRRDKFRGERTESHRSGEGRRDDRRRDDWIEREPWANRSRPRGEYRGAMRERYSPARQHDMSPPLKRMRTDWMVEQPETQPPMLSFKAFLQTQDDNITDDEAIRKYNEYKLEFRRQQLNEFFVSHKEEEWFKLKYHPEDSAKRKEELMAGLKKRVDVFMEFLENGRIEKVSIDGDHSDQLVKLLDAVVIRLEGGTDLDLSLLDEVQITEVKEVVPPTPPVEQPVIKEEPGLEKVDSGTVKQIKEEKEDDKTPSEEDKNGSTKETEEDEKKDAEKDKEEDDDEEAASDKDKDVSMEEDEDKSAKADETEEENSKQNGKSDVADEEDSEKSLSSEKLPEKENKEDEAMSVEGDDLEDNPTKEKEEERVNKAKEQESKEDVVVSLEEDDDDAEKKAEPEIQKEKPRELHRTASIFLRNLSPNVTKAEVENMCKRYPGFLRAAIADPLPERRWFRRGWVTFKRDVNIKEICWNLNTIRLRDCELGAIVNRDLSRRVRTATWLTSHKQVIRHDMKLSAKIIQNLDTKTGLWQDNSKSQEQSFGLVSLNPVLHNITDYLIEEASAEEEELLGQAAEAEDNEEKDQNLLKVLDRLLLYLRIVHSVDYYNHCEYPNEDEMPNRCGIMHARGTLSSSKVSTRDVTEYCQNFQQKMSCLMSLDTPLEGEELVALGAKEADAEVEKFVAANTQELAKDKWLCPLSGKKFKGPEFVRKHIFNKHAEKVDEVKKEVEYFNNYLRDPKRPQLAEHPGNRPAKKEPMNEPMQPAFMPPFHYGGYGGGRGFQHYGGYGGYGSGYSRPRGGYNRGGRGGVSDFRPVIHYRDLDAPREPDEFI